MSTRIIVFTVATALALSSWPSAQGIYREPSRDSRSVSVAVADPPPPVELRSASVSLSPVSSSLRLAVEARAVRGTVPGAGITVRLAFKIGTRMQSQRLVRDTHTPGGQAVPSVLPRDWIVVPFVLAPGEAMPALTASNPDTPGTVTIERIVDANGTEIWVNPDARELLWNTLGLKGTAQSRIW